jgi:zinc protease
MASGLTAIVVPMPASGLAAYWTIVRTGSRDEYERGRTGFAHFFEHMMFRGTEKYPNEVYTAKLTEMGVSDNAFTTDDFTAYHLSGAAADLAVVAELESDRFLHLSYSETDFRTEAGAVYGEYRKNRSSPIFTLLEALQAVAFERHTYGHTTMGYEADIQAMPTLFDHSRRFFSRYYRPDNSVILVVGDVEVEPTLDLLRRHYGGWQPGYEPPEVPAEPEQREERRLEVAYDGASLPILWVAYKADPFQPASRPMAALDLLGALAFGETSDLYRRLVLDEQRVELLSAELPESRDPGLFFVAARVKDAGQVEAVLAAIDGEIARYQAAPVPPERLADLKSRLKYGFLMNLETPAGVARAVASTIALTGGLDALDELFNTYQSVTPEDVQAAARSYLVPTRRTVAVLRGAS